MSMLSVGEICRQIGVRRGVEIAPQKVSDLLYRRKIPASRCPVVAGQRRIPDDLVPQIERILQERGILSGDVVNAS
jgi:hypothetical protein